jgi:hypothetical protein
MLKKIKNAINKYLEDMAKENQKTFGKGRMDCCEINKKSMK